MESTAFPLFALPDDILCNILHEWIGPYCWKVIKAISAMEVALCSQQQLRQPCQGWMRSEAMTRLLGLIEYDTSEKNVKTEHKIAFMRWLGTRGVAWRMLSVQWAFGDRGAVFDPAQCFPALPSVHSLELGPMDNLDHVAWYLKTCCNVTSLDASLDPDAAVERFQALGSRSADQPSRS